MANDCLCNGSEKSQTVMERTWLLKADKGQPLFAHNKADPVHKAGRGKWREILTDFVRVRFVVYADTLSVDTVNLST